MKIRNTRILRKRLLLSNLDVNLLGPDLVLENCSVHSDCQSKALIISGLVMTDGHFNQQDRALTDFHFEFAHFSDVKFTGKFVGCTFGDWVSAATSSIRSCDFTEAGLEDCRFLNCDIESTRLPKWPAFTIVNPAEARDFVMSARGHRKRASHWTFIPTPIRNALPSAVMRHSLLKATTFRFMNYAPC